MMNTTQEAYLFYEAGQAVAAAHLRLKVHHVSSLPLENPTRIAAPKKSPKVQIILWLAALACERRGTGHSHPLRRTRTRQRIHALLDAYTNSLPVSNTKRASTRRQIMSQAQDRANAISINLFPAVEQLVARLRDSTVVDGSTVVQIVQKTKAAIRASRRQESSAATPPP